jgi:hypothetical protein
MPAHAIASTTHIVCAVLTGKEYTNQQHGTKGLQMLCLAGQAHSIPR